MILGTLKAGGRDGTLIVVDPARTRAVVAKVAATLQQALDDWDEVSPKLAAIADELRRGERPDAFPLAADDLV